MTKSKTFRVVYSNCYRIRLCREAGRIIVRVSSMFGDFNLYSKVCSTVTEAAEFFRKARDNDFRGFDLGFTAV